MLVVFAGLPGSGKTTIARLVADRLGATFLRVDSIETALASCGCDLAGSPAGYVVAERVAADQLRAGRPVVVDAVNAVEAARAGWRRLGDEHGTPARFVEVVCSDPSRHRERVETRRADLAGHVLPTWDDVTGQVWEPFAEHRILADNLGTAEAAADSVLAAL